MTQPPSTPQAAGGIGRLERRVMAIGTAIVLHAVIIGGAVAAVAVERLAGRLGVFPHEPLLMTAVALLLAHCSLGAIWWARSSWPSYAKTLVAVLAAALLWLLLVGVLEATNLNEIDAAGWAAALATQLLLAGLGAAALELALRPADFSASRFTILFLMLWTAVVAVLLGAGRAVAQALDWKLADLWNWEWLYQLQTLAVGGAVLADGLLTALRVPRDWRVRAFASFACLFVVALATPTAMFLIFKNVGASFADVFWLIFCQGLFLLATLVPLEAAQQRLPAPPR